MELAKNSSKQISKTELKFGKVFTDHMLQVEWVSDKIAGKKDSLNNTIPSKAGWQIPKIVPFGPLTLSPSCNVFHYGIEAFEGLKAYKSSDGLIYLFRPMMNMHRLLLSSRRLGLPEFDKEIMLEYIKKLILIEKDWIPTGDGYSLYIRPMIIGLHDAIGLSPTERAMFNVICSPVGPYYSTGFKAISLLGECSYVRSWPGGTGAYKIGGNYAPGVLPQLKAIEKGHQQVLWLIDKGKGLQLTEVGTMNLFIYWKNEHGDLELVTPELDGTILLGVTRDSIVKIVKDDSFLNIFPSSQRVIAVERLICMSEIELAARENRLFEMFGCGTAAIISPVKEIEWTDPGTHDTKCIKIPLDPTDPNQQAGPLARALTSRLQDIQYGRIQFNNWSVLFYDPQSSSENQIVS